MKTTKFLSFIVLTALLLPVIASAGIIEEYCFLNNFGQTYRLSGGKLGKKAYVVEANVGAPCGILNGVATVASLTGGGYSVTMYITRDAGAVCSTAVFNLLTPNNFLTGTGNFDNLPRNLTPDGNLTMTQISCGSFLTSASPAKAAGPAPNVAE